MRPILEHVGFVGEEVEVVEVGVGVVGVLVLLKNKGSPVPLTPAEMQELAESFGVTFPKTTRSIRAGMCYHPFGPTFLFVRIECDALELPGTNERISWVGFRRSRNSSYMFGGTDFDWWDGSAIRPGDAVFENRELNVAVVARKQDKRGRIYLARSGPTDHFSGDLIAIMEVQQSNALGQWRASLYERQWP